LKRAQSGGGDKKGEGELFAHLSPIKKTGASKERRRENGKKAASSE